MFIPRWVFQELSKDLQREIGQAITLVENDNQYYTREAYYNSAILSCGKNAWNNISRVRVSKTIQKFKEQYKAECVLDLCQGRPRIKINY